MKNNKIMFLIFLNLWGWAAKAETICNDCLPKAIGDIVHRASGISTFYVGHAGILLQKKGNGDLQIAFVIGDLDLPGTAADVGNFKSGPKSFMENHSMDEFWGAKRYVGGEPLNDLQQRELVKLVANYIRNGVEYDYNHLNQKGMKLENGHWEFDCVGFVEHLWEKITNLQRDPTPEKDEKPFLTVRTQRDSFQVENVN